MRLQLRADLAQLNRIREFITESATALNVSASSFDDLRLAVDEVVTNVITHGYEGPGDIEIEVDAVGKDLVIHLRDQAPSFDQAHTLAGTDPTEPRDTPGGFGLHLIQSAMDEVSHRPLEPGNELTMTKRNVISSE
jgi:anti-sigma regulatory factor (Ser/Thr protein kinase)